jgi:hypothetical protein
MYRMCLVGRRGQTVTLRLFRNLKFHRYIYNSSQLSPVQNPVLFRSHFPKYSFMMHFNIILLTTPWTLNVFACVRIFVYQMHTTGFFNHVSHPPTFCALDSNILHKIQFSKQIESVSLSYSQQTKRTKKNQLKYFQYFWVTSNVLRIFHEIWLSAFVMATNKAGSYDAC